MATYYIDPVNGNDANDGLSWGTAYKTMLNGPTSARLGLNDSDEIRIAKSPDPVSIGSVTWTNNSATVTFSTCSNITIDNCESGWTAGLVTPTYPTTTFREGSRSLQAVLSTTNGKVCYKTLTALDLSGHSRITFWVNLGTAVNYSTGCPIQVRLCSDTTGDAAVNTFTLPSYYYPANYWVPVTVDAGGALGASIQSVALYTTAAVTNTIRVDNITVAKASSDATSLVLTDMIAKDNGNGEYFPICYIDGTNVCPMQPFNANATVTWGVGFNYCDGINGTQTINTLKRWGFDTAATIITTATTTTVGNINYTDANFSPLTKTYVGGVNPATDLVDGESWFDGVTGYGNGLTQTNSSHANYTLSNVGAIRYYVGLVTAEGANVTIDNTSLVNNRTTYDFRYHTQFTQGSLFYQQAPAELNVKWAYSGSGGVGSVGTMANNAYGVDRLSTTYPIFRMTNAFAVSGGYIFAAGQVGYMYSTGTIHQCQGTIGIGVPIQIPVAGYAKVNNVLAIGLTSSFRTAALVNIVNIQPHFQELPSIRLYFTGRMGVAADTMSTQSTVQILNRTVATATSPVVVEGVGPNNYLYTNGNMSLPTLVGRWCEQTHMLNCNSNLPLSSVAPRLASLERSYGNVVFTNWNGDNATSVYNLTGYSSSASFYAAPQWIYQSAVTYSGNTAIRAARSAGNNSAVGSPCYMRLGRLALQSGTQATISLRCRRSSTLYKGFMYVVINNVDNPDAVVYTTGNINEWELLSTTFTPTENMVVNVYAGIQQLSNSTDAESYTYFDDLQVTQA